jgi:[acyl-carrier-protein] S-malonyltransferase
MLSSNIGLIFAGQGSQFPGMGKSLAEAFPEAREAFDEADSALGEKLSALCFSGPQALLDDTLNAQPAVLTCSVAIWRVVSSRVPVQPIAAAGHSLGQYSALVAAGAMDLASAVRLVRRRAQLMASAGPGTGMLVVLGLADADVESLCAEAAAISGASLSVANYNCPGQVVLAGQDAALSSASELAQQRGAKLAARLALSAASHTPLLEAAVAPLAEALAATRISRPSFPVAGSAAHDWLVSPDDVREDLARQIVTPLRWPAMVTRLANRGAEVLLELSPKPVLAGLCRRLTGLPPVRSISKAEDISALEQA